MSRIAVVVGCCLLAVLAGSSVSAGSLCGGCGDGVRKAFNMSIDVVAPEYDASKAVLQSKGASDWTDEEVYNYLQTSLLLIYYANCLLLLDQDGVPMDPQAAANGGYLAEWPLNPFNEWQPIVIRDVSEGFHAGDVARELCPPDYYTGNEARSFQLYIFGPTTEFSVPGTEVKSINPWGSIPSGTAFSVGLRAESDSEREAREKMLEEAQ